MNRRQTFLSVLACAVLFGHGVSAPAGTITGTVRAKGPEASSGGDDSGGSYGSRRYKFLEKVDYESLRDFVVSIDRVPFKAAAGGTGAKAEIRQKDGEFEPRVLPVVAGTDVEFINMDDIFHNVFSMSDSCAFDLGLYKRGDGSKHVSFDLPGRVDIFCSIHTKMNCIVLVLPNPWFARTNEKGAFVIRDVPAGTYKLKAWHDRLPPQLKEVVVPEQGEVRLDFELAVGRPRKD